MTLLKIVERYLSAGQAPIPIWPDKRKNPHLSSTREYQQRQPTMSEWRRWAHQWPHCNVGLITGYHGLVALDFDTVSDYDAWSGPKGSTWTVATHRGYHVWLQADFDAGKSRMFINGDHEVLLRARGGYCIVPPSRHWRGSQYQTVHNVPPLRVDNILDIIDWSEAITKKPSATPSQVGHNLRPVNITTLVSIPDGSRPNSRGAHKVRCPVHDDRTPSAWVNLAQGRFGCNVCTPNGYVDTIGLYALINHLSNSEAYHALTQSKGDKNNV